MRGSKVTKGSGARPRRSRTTSDRSFRITAIADSFDRGAALSLQESEIGSLMRGAQIIVAVVLLLAQSCAFRMACPKTIPPEQLFFSMFQEARGYVAYKGRFADIYANGISATGFRRRSCRRMDESAFRELKALLDSDAFRKEFEATSAKDYAHMGIEERMLVVAYGGKWTLIPFSRLSVERLTPLLARADALIEGEDAIRNGVAAFPHDFGPQDREPATP
jgi:hypothetical protein